LSSAQRNRTLVRNFQGYTTDDTSALIGFGSSAVSALPQGYAQNQVAMPAYRGSILRGELATARGVSVTDDDRVRRAFIAELMCYGELDVERTAQRFGRCSGEFSAEMAVLREFARDGLVELSGTFIKVAAQANVAVRVICAAFDHYLPKAPAVHAPAV
jgi:oxygen-independent coproporphyrinogen-3 oxidase